MSTRPQSITVAAIQMEAEFCDTDANLRKAAEWVRKAQKLGAKWIMLPEFFTSGLAWDPRMCDAWEPLDGKPTQMLKQLAREGDTVVGGSFLAKSGRHIRNTLVLAMPDGRTFTHDKDIPSIGESCYFVGGEDGMFLDEMTKRGHVPKHRAPIPTRDGNNIQGVFDIDGMTVGGMLCWELIRSRTVKRFAVGEVEMVIGASGWPDWSPEVDPPPGLTKKQLEEASRIYHQLIVDMPLYFARKLRVPVIHANQVGQQWSGASLESSATHGDRILLRFLGNSLIADGDGSILAHRGRNAGSGIVIADVTPGRRGPVGPIESADFFIPTERPYVDKLFFQPENRDYYFARTLPRANKEGDYAEASLK